MNEEDLRRLVRTLASGEHESECVEFKENRAEAEEIGAYLSAISNSAALHQQDVGYIVWGVRDGDHKIVGSTFLPRHASAKVGNEDLEAWLSRMLHPRIDFRIHELEVDGHHVVVFEVPAASHTPVRFRHTEFIRVGSYRKKLRDHPEKERELWLMASRSSFESGIALRGAESDRVLELLDYPSYFELTKQRLPDNRAGILERLAAERLIVGVGEDRFDITNLGGILFAKDLSRFEGLSRKSVRVIVYRGRGRTEALRERVGQKGYASGFAGLVDFVNDQLPENEHIERALRAEARMYPEIAIRELVANALIHQDFNLGGTGPMIEIFEGRVEITNPGVPLIETQRFLDMPPESRNEVLAAFMRRLNICEERGSGIDKVITAIELFQLTAPDFRVTDRHTKALLFAHKAFAEMDKADRIRACYQHAGLMFVTDQQMTNATLRQRLSISAENYSMASRVIRDSLDAGLIKPHDPTSTSKKHARYLPFWA